jgi:hypothetical protein
MQCIYNYIPETNHVSAAYNVAAIPWLQCMVYVMLFPVISFCTFTLGLSEVLAQCTLWLCSAVPWCRAFPICCSGILWMIFRRFLLPLLFLSGTTRCDADMRRVRTETASHNCDLRCTMVKYYDTFHNGHLHFRLTELFNPLILSQLIYYLKSCETYGIFLTVQWLRLI